MTASMDQEEALIMVVEDDPADWMMIQEAFEDAHVGNDVQRIVDGVDLLKHLRTPGNRRPGIILLDLNMPRLNGFETLREIRNDPDLRHLVVVLMTTSSTETDIYQGYNNGANSYIVKPLTFESMIDALKVLGRYWTELVALPA